MYHVNKSSKNTHDGTIIRKEKGRKEKEKKNEQCRKHVHKSCRNIRLVDGIPSAEMKFTCMCTVRKQEEEILDTLFSFRFLAIHNWSRSIINTNKRISMKKKKKNAKRFLYRTKVCHGTSLVLDDSKGMSVEKNAWPLLFH